LSDFDLSEARALFINFDKISIFLKNIFQLTLEQGFFSVSLEVSAEKLTKSPLCSIFIKGGRYD